jgi:ADP-heptose:LPS heptosyltransferase
VDDVHERLRWCQLLAAFGVPADPFDLRLSRPQVPSPVPGAVVVHPGAGHGSRRWPPARFAAVAATLARQGHRVVVTGSRDQLGLAAEVAHRAWLPPAALLAGRTSLAQLAALVADARLVVCPDTGIAHLSYAYGTPSVVLFGPAPVRQWGPPPGPHLALGDDDQRRGEPFAADPDPAMLAVDPADVIDAAHHLLTGSPAARTPTARTARTARM